MLKIPTQTKKPDFNLDKYNILIYGREKIGKTELAAQFPNNLFIPTEEGTKGLKVYTPVDEDGNNIESIHCWDEAVDIISGLENTKHIFKRVTIDTADLLYELCSDFMCEKLGIENLGETESGEKDFGISYKQTRKEFMGLFDRIKYMGMGTIFVSHFTEFEIKPKGGESYSRIIPSMSKQARRVIEGLVDMSFYIENMRNNKGGLQRVIFTRGDETVWAGGRKSQGGNMPQYLPLEGGYEIIKKAFEGTYAGLDPATLLPAKSTPVTTRTLINKTRIETLKRKA